MNRNFLKMKSVDKCGLALAGYQVPLRSLYPSCPQLHRGEKFSEKVMS